MKRTNYYSYGITFLITFVFVIIWLIEIIKGDMPQIDIWMQQFTQQFTDTPIYTMFRAITELGSFHVVAPLTVVTTIALGIIYRDYRPAITLALGVLTTHILNTLIKSVVQRERPSISAALNAEGFSYPSGHAMVSTVCYGIIAYFIIRKLKQASTRKIVLTLFTITIFLIGLSRPFLNVHYTTDIITGFFLGTISLYTWIQFYLFLKK